MVISDYYFNVLKEDERSIFRDEILRRTGISYPTFYSKLKKCSWTRAEVEVINIIIKERNNARKVRVF